jgi:ornithine cyclodeaminase/alanine dehydrogenase-like protein (mu-crystallin family)
MVLFLNEDNVKELITMPLALEQVERALKDRALGKATDLPRTRVQTTAGIQHVLQVISVSNIIFRHPENAAQPTCT